MLSPWLLVAICNISGGILVFGDPLAVGAPGTLADVVAWVPICGAGFLAPVPESQSTRTVAALAA